MRLLDLRCPNCGADLQVNDQLQKCTCNYCGHTFLIDDEAVNYRVQDPRELGRELEYGRRSAMGANQDLIEAVGELTEAVTQLKPLFSHADRLEKEVQSQKKRLEFHETAFGKSLPWIFAVLVSAFILYNIFSGAEASSIVGLIFFLWFIPLLPIVIRSSIRKKYAVKTEQLEKLHFLMNEYDEIMQKYDINIIPPDYRNKSAMNFIYHALVNQRAMTMQEAVNLYEDECHKRRMETMQRENLRVSRQNAAVNTINMLRR